MILVSTSEWNNSRAKNLSERVLVERWLELFNRYTIDIYRVRFHNSHTILRELLELIDISTKFDLPLKHLQWVAKEASSILKNDIVIKDIILSYSVLINELNNNLYWSGKEPLQKIRVLLSNIVQSLDQHYLKSLIGSIKEKTNKNDNKSVLKLIEFIASECIFMEFSTWQLYRLKELFFAQNENSFDERLNDFIKCISSDKKKFTVIIRFEAYYPSEFPSKISDILINRSFTPKTTSPLEIGYLAKGHYTWFAQMCVDAKDSYMAGVGGAQELGAAMDVYSYGFPLNEIYVDEKALIYQKEGRPFERVDSRPLIPGFYKSESSWFNTINDNLTAIYENRRILDTTKDKIRSSLRYIRQGRAAINVEEKFMNLWIALEFLLRVEGYRNILDPIIEFAPKILSLYHPRRLIRDLIENINRLEIVYSKHIRLKLDKEREFSKKEASMLSILRNKQNKKDLIKSCNSSPLLQYRINKLADSFSSSEEIWKMIKLNTQDIEWHLARIYRHRNRIVHGAEYNLSISQLSSNVTAYVTEILNEIIHQLSKREEWNSIDDVILAYAQNYDIRIARLKKDKNNEITLDEIVDPLETLLPISKN